jgi:hypothetical protein
MDALYNPDQYQTEAFKATRSTTYLVTRPRRGAASVACSEKHIGAAERVVLHDCGADGPAPRR